MPSRPRCGCRRRRGGGGRRRDDVRTRERGHRAARIPLRRPRGVRRHARQWCDRAKAAYQDVRRGGRVIDYAASDFTAETRTYDVIVDCVANAPFSCVQHLVNAGGALFLVIADLRGLVLASRNGRESRKVVAATGAKPTAKTLQALVELAEAGRYRAVCDRIFDFVDIADAHAFVDKGHKTGNVILRVASR